MQVFLWLSMHWMNTNATSDCLPQLWAKYKGSLPDGRQENCASSKAVLAAIIYLYGVWLKHTKKRDETGRRREDKGERECQSCGRAGEMLQMEVNRENIHCNSIDGSAFSLKQTKNYFHNTNIKFQDLLTFKYFFLQLPEVQKSSWDSWELLPALR